MAKIIGWEVKEDKILLKIMGMLIADGEDMGFIELPQDIYCEILKDGPPNEDKMIRDLVIEIHKVRKDRVLTVDAVDKELAEIGKEEKEAMEALKGAETKLDVEKWSAILRSLAGRRANQGQRRHLVKLLHQEEGALSKKLLEKK